MSVLDLMNVSKSFGEGSAAVKALAHATLSVAPGTMVAVMGPSGAGKSNGLRGQAKNSAVLASTIQCCRVMSSTAE
jgi:ABC-type lipoprotein export system ATPase subunit